LFAVLTDDVAVLQGSSVDEAARARKYPPFLWDINNCRRSLPSVPLVRKRKHYGLPKEEAGHQSIRFGQYARASSTLPALTNTRK